MIYICSLYSNGLQNCPMPRILLEKRVAYTQKRVYELLMEGKFPYSPILHCHELSKKYDLPSEYKFWQDIDRNAIEHCSEVYVLMIGDLWGNWRLSTGITDEVKYAEWLGKKITYLNCDDYE